MVTLTHGSLEIPGYIESTPLFFMVGDYLPGHSSKVDLQTLEGKNCLLKPCRYQVLLSAIHVRKVRSLVSVLPSQDTRGKAIKMEFKGKRKKKWTLSENKKWQELAGLRGQTGWSGRIISEAAIQLRFESEGLVCVSWTHHFWNWNAFIQYLLIMFPPPSTSPRFSPTSPPTQLCVLSFKKTNKQTNKNKRGPQKTRQTSQRPMRRM